jgi:hypothetical protein
MFLIDSNVIKTSSNALCSLRGGIPQISNKSSDKVTPKNDNATAAEADEVMKTIAVENYTVSERITSETDLTPVNPIIFDTNKVPAWPYLIAPATLTQIRIAYQGINGTYIESLPISPDSGSVVVGSKTINGVLYTILRIATAATDYNNMHAKIIDIL